MEILLAEKSAFIAGNGGRSVGLFTDSIYAPNLMTEIAHLLTTEDFL